MPHFVTADLGHSELKSVRLDTRHVQKMPYGMKALGNAEWKAEVARANKQPAAGKTKTFLMDGKPVQVGAQAALDFHYSQLRGSEKYTPDHMKFLMAAQLLMHWPKGTSEEIHLSIAHPPDAVHYRSMLAKSVGGRYVITVPGLNKKVKFHVKTVTPWDEASGAVTHWLANTAPEKRIKESIIIVDIGGKISSMTKADISKINNKWQINVQYTAESSVTYWSGILTIYDRIKDELKNTYSDLVQPLLPISYDICKEIVEQKGYFRIHNDMVDVTEAYTQAIISFESEFKTAYSKLGSGLRANRIVCSGGGTGALYHLLPDWLNHPNITPAHNLKFIEEANVLGGNEIFRDEMTYQGKYNGK